MEKRATSSKINPKRAAIYLNRDKDQDIINFIEKLGKGNFSDWVKTQIRKELTPQPKPIDNQELIHIIEQIIETKLQGKVITEQKSDEVEESVKDVLSELDDYF